MQASTAATAEDGSGLRRQGPMAGKKVARENLHPHKHTALLRAVHSVAFMPPASPQLLVHA